MRKKLQLVGLVAMLLACKYEEVTLPVVDDLVFISDKAYARKEVLEMVDDNDISIDISYYYHIISTIPKDVASSCSCRKN